MKLCFLFGKSGAGKSYVGRVCAEDFGFRHYEGDQDLTPEMKQAIQERRAFTPAMRADFSALLRGNVERAWHELAVAEPGASGLVVSQGLFKERERVFLSQSFPLARWVWVRVR